jgi:hypothetical protein
MPAGSLAYVFGHGQFIQAARAIVADSHLDDRGKMLGFWRKGEPPAISNAERVGFHWQDGRWACAERPQLTVFHSFCGQNFICNTKLHNRGLVEY